ncbi:hypothetical protein PBCVKS1B_329L [Paramecium bursaria Chlorella virus KS1B]|nr:hypothetical protein PBCVKS1B_329L [Paramecium bursaria Chlorella virus KS1B]
MWISSRESPLPFHSIYENATQTLVKSLDFATLSNCGNPLKLVIPNHIGNCMMAESGTRVW